MIKTLLIPITFSKQIGIGSELSAKNCLGKGITCSGFISDLHLWRGQVLLEFSADHYTTAAEFDENCTYVTLQLRHDQHEVHPLATTHQSLRAARFQRGWE